MVVVYIKSANPAKRPSLYEVNQAWAAQRSKALQKSRQMSANFINGLAAINIQTSQQSVQASDTGFAGRFLNKLI